MEYKGKLELTWVGKYDDKVIEPRVLMEDREKSYGDPRSENMLIHGDNLIALQALQQDFAGRIKCVYIDPPYNTGSAFEHYDDNLEHSIWLSLMKQRLILLRELLSDDGFLCCQIDDSESHYIKVLLDEIFGRNNYLTTLYIRVRYPDKTWIFIRKLNKFLSIENAMALFQTLIMMKSDLKSLSMKLKKLEKDMKK